MIENDLKEKLVEIVKLIDDPWEQRQTIYDAMDALGIHYTKTNCKKCVRDYYNIVREELGLIKSAAEISDYNDVEVDSEWKYLKQYPTAWNGHILDQNTDPKIIAKFMSKGAKKYYKRIIK